MREKITTKAVHLCLAKLIEELIRVGEAGWSPSNILYRVMTEAQVNRVGKPGHRILAPEMHRDARFIQPAFNALSIGDKLIVVTKHRPKPDGYDDWGSREMADYLNEPSAGAFNAKYNKILKKVKNRLT